MSSKKQISAAKENIKKAQAKWKSMSKHEHTLAQPQGRGRQRPGATGKGKFYHIEVRPKYEFTTFRVQDVGGKGGLERVAGKRGSGSWATAAWLVSKESASVENRELMIHDPKVRTVLKSLRGPIVHVKGDIFKCHERKNVPEKDKPTPAQRRAQSVNIKKAQEARWDKLANEEDNFLNNDVVDDKVIE